MKILSWNLGAAAGRWRDVPALRERAWHRGAALDPDLAFLQETQPPEWARERWTVLTLPYQFWASALVARAGLALRCVAPDPGSLLGRFGSYLSTGELQLGDETALLVASVHTRAAEAPEWVTAGHDRVALARTSVGVPWSNDVAFAAYRELVGERRFLIGGDWNTSRWLDADGVPAPDGQEFFDRAQAAGWVQLSLDAEGREGKSWYGSTNPRFCQLDHVFADARTAACLRSFRIDPYPVEALGLSDHAPLVLELDVDLAAATPAAEPAT